MSDLIKTLPLFLRKSQVFQEVFKAEENKFQLSANELEDLQKQMDISTATWGLAIYEKELQIKTDLSKPLSERRSVIKSKWRGAGKIDAALIKMVADAYTNGDVDITFDGRINIKFNSIIGIPPNLQDLQNAIEDIKPAHLRIIYEFAYLLIKGIDKIVSLNEIEQIPLNKFAGGV